MRLKVGGNLVQQFASNFSRWDLQLSREKRISLLVSMPTATFIVLALLSSCMSPKMSNQLAILSFEEHFMCSWGRAFFGHGGGASLRFCRAERLFLSPITAFISSFVSPFLLPANYFAERWSECYQAKGPKLALRQQDWLKRDWRREKRARPLQ